ncbi:MAG: hypothetical protein KGJ44_09935 [Betaproteobacteria bacterium]|nr:hypothetical protein [Betaproteobacteria bacterium]
MFFTDGVAIDDGNLILSAGYSDAPEAMSSRIYLNFGDWWGVHEVSNDFIVSIAYKNGVLFAIGKNGLVKTVGRQGEVLNRESIKGKFRNYTVKAAESIGHLTQVRAVAHEFFAVGWGGQVYRLFADSYETLEVGVQNIDEQDLLDIDGFSNDQLYAVGLNGALLYYDGRTWLHEDAPTNAHFYAVRCLPNGVVMLAGSNGTLYSGRHGLWKRIDTDMDGNFWSIQDFHDAVYLSYGDNKLFEYKNDVLQEMKVDLLRNTHTNKLTRSANLLWSIGSDCIAQFDGRAWQRRYCPDQAESPLA